MSHPEAHRHRWGWAWLVGALVIVAAAAVIGYGFGLHSGRTVTVRSGVAWSSGVQAMVTSQGVEYNVPLGVDSVWYGGGSEHFGGTPSCLPAFRKVDVTFATTEFYRDGALNSAVMWVRC